MTNVFTRRIERNGDDSEIWPGYGCNYDRVVDPHHWWWRKVCVGQTAIGQGQDEHKQAHKWWRENAAWRKSKLRSRRERQTHAVMAGKCRQEAAISPTRKGACACVRIDPNFVHTTAIFDTMRKERSNEKITRRPLRPAHSVQPLPTTTGPAQPGPAHSGEPSPTDPTQPDPAHSGQPSPTGSAQLGPAHSGKPSPTAAGPAQLTPANLRPPTQPSPARLTPANLRPPARPSTARLTPANLHPLRPARPSSAYSSQPSATATGPAHSGFSDLPPRIAKCTCVHLIVFRLHKKGQAGRSGRVSIWLRVS
ncbi:hypothetical protein J6590_048209 [Homalodisca vitripennis]|nr:hypothetical protein J6590_048209 [Homalodisca vitripennis]